VEVPPQLALKLREAVGVPHPAQQMRLFWLPSQGAQLRRARQL
jgi:hypothetical protein